MRFGFTLKPEHSIERTLALTRQAEAAGFEYGWLFDSHVLWRDPYPLLTLMAGATERMRLGTCVTNPGTREPSVTASALATLDEISGGRMAAFEKQALESTWNLVPIHPGLAKYMKARGVWDSKWDSNVAH